MTTPVYSAERPRTLPWAEKMPEDVPASDAKHTFEHAKPVANDVSAEQPKEQPAAG